MQEGVSTKDHVASAPSIRATEVMSVAVQGLGRHNHVIGSSSPSR
jgi:hypothetical protein